MQVPGWTSAVHNRLFGVQATVSFNLAQPDLPLLPFQDLASRNVASGVLT